MIGKDHLKKWYVTEKKSAKEIADMQNCSESKVNYWLKKYEIKKRSVSDAIYVKNNPNGDPFSFKKPSNHQEWMLYGLGLGLYWGEGTKSNTHSVRLGNTDPHLVKSFVRFLTEIFSVSNEKITFGLQIFSDMDPKKALSFWQKELGVSDKQFYKVTVTQSGKVGSYRNKTQHGVLTVYCNNKKLRDMLVSMVAEL